jgi:hypothetical protein
MHPGCPPTCAAVWRRSELRRLAAFWPTRRLHQSEEERRLQNEFQPFVRLRSCEGYVYSAAREFLREVEMLKGEHLSRRELRKVARLRRSDAPIRQITSFHADRITGAIFTARIWPAKSAAAFRVLIARSDWRDSRIRSFAGRQMSSVATALSLRRAIPRQPPVPSVPWEFPRFSDARASQTMGR